MALSKDAILTKLKDWNIVHETISHALSPTCEEHSQHLKGTSFEKFVGRGQAKNLFYKVPSGGGKLKNRLFLVCALVDTIVDNKELSIRLGIKASSPMRLAADDVYQNILQVPVGATTPFVLANPSTSAVVLLLDHKFRDCEKLLFHPLQSDHTTALSPDQLDAFLGKCAASRFMYVDFGKSDPIPVPELGAAPADASGSKNQSGGKPDAKAKSKASNKKSEDTAVQPPVGKAEAKPEAKGPATEAPPVEVSRTMAERAIGTLYYVEETIYKAHKAMIAAKFNGIVLNEQKFDTVKDMHKPNFVAMNPVKKVPFLETDIGCIFTSNAIARYIARCRADTGLYGECFDDEGAIETWLEFAIYEIELPLATMVYPLIGLMDTPSAEVVNIAEKDLKVALAVLEERLKVSPFLVGSSVTLADIALVCSLREGMTCALDPAFRKPYPKVTAWFETCCAMSEFKAVLGETVLCSKVEKSKFPPPATKEVKAKVVAAPKPEPASKKQTAPKKESTPKKEAAPAAEELKAQAAAASATAPTPAPTPAAAPAAGGDDLDAQIKAKGNEVRELKAKLKADGLSGKKVDKHDDVVKLVAELNELKAKK